MLKKIFQNLNYEEYCSSHSINELEDLNISLKDYGKINKKKIKKWDMVLQKPLNIVPSPPELDDLIRLHYLLTIKKSRTVLEFGVGKSTGVILDALGKNQKEHSVYVENKLRISNPFELHSVDNYHIWLDKIKHMYKKNKNFNTHYCPVSMGTFNDRICTYYDNLPNIRPDFIYLDGPNQFGVLNNVRGITTENPDRMPMSADLLALEHFFEPGTMILIDGRTANARFLKSNFQRNWDYYHFESYDQHVFRLDEKPLGIWNENALKFENEYL